MVHIELEHSNARLRIAGDLVEQFDAKLIGIAVGDPHPSYYADGSVVNSFVEHERGELRKQMVEVHFSTPLGSPAFLPVGMCLLSLCTGPATSIRRTWRRPLSKARCGGQSMPAHLSRPALLDLLQAAAGEDRAIKVRAFNVP